MAETENNEQGKALELSLGAIEKKFGKGSIMRMGENAHMQVEVVPSGALSLDVALGVGGLPKGRIVEIYGPESSGKSTFALGVVAEAQRQGGICAYIDAEHAMDPAYAAAIGVNVDELLISQPGCGEEGLEITDMLIKSGVMSVVVVDSVAALTPKAELEGDMGAAHVGLQARLMSQALRKLSGSISKTGAIVIFINQLREKVGVMFGSPETQPGGRALKFYSSVRLDIRKIESIKDGNDVTGNRVRVKVVKNKVAAPFKQCEFDIIFGKGISREGNIVDLGVDLGVVVKAGAWFTYQGEQLGQGRAKAIETLRGDPAMCEAIRRDVWEKVAPDLGVEITDHGGDHDAYVEDGEVALPADVPAPTPAAEAPAPGTPAMAPQSVAAAEPGVAVADSQPPIREWAKANGFNVGDRGPLPPTVKEAYDAAFAIIPAKGHVDSLAEGELVAAVG